MDQDLSHWLRAHQTEIQDQWWAKAQDMGLVSAETLEKLTRESALSRDCLLQLLTSLDSGEPPNPD